MSGEEQDLRTFELGRDYVFTWVYGVGERREVWTVLEQEGTILKAVNASGETKYINTTHGDFVQAELQRLA